MLQIHDVDYNPLLRNRTGESESSININIT